MKNELGQIYENRFSGHEKYRNEVWKILTKQFFSRWIDKNAKVLDLGCGYGEFINNIQCHVRHAMDLNPNTQNHLTKEVIFHEQDCSKPWQIAPESLDIIFTSNFFEHLPNKQMLNQTVKNIRHALKSGGKIIAMGPNIAALGGNYWDFWDHHIALSNQSLCELMKIHNFNIEKSVDKFLPYNMVREQKKPLCFVHLYLRFPILWHFWGKQFLIVAKK